MKQLVLHYYQECMYLMAQALLMCLTSSGHVMSHLMSDDDHREQVFLDSELPVLWRLTCGAMAGAVAQSGQCMRH